MIPYKKFGMVRAKIKFAKVRAKLEPITFSNNKQYRYDLH